MIIFIILLVILGKNFYVFFRLWHILPEGKILLIAAAILLVLCFFVGMLGEGLLPSSIVGLAYRIGTAWFFIALYLLLIFLCLDVLSLVLPMHKILHENWLTIGILAFSLTTVFVYGYFNYRNKQRVELNLTINKPISPLKIVAISDLHLGYNIGTAELDEWIKLINLENPDLVLITGDIIDNHIVGVAKQNFSFEKIKSRYGVYACLGNHEYIGNSSKINQSLDFLRSAKITVLRDTALLINNEFYLIGRDDRTNLKRKSLPELLQTLDTTKPVILLDHQPFNLDDTEKNGIDLQVSGHTHSGQLLPFSWIVNLMYENPHGYLRKNNSHIYVSSGIGIWGGKFRIGTRSEYAVINISQELNPQPQSHSCLTQPCNGQNAKFTSCASGTIPKNENSPLATTWQRLRRTDCCLPQRGNDQDERIAACHSVAMTKTNGLPLATAWQRPGQTDYCLPQCGNDQDEHIATYYNVAMTNTNGLPLNTTWQRLKHSIYTSLKHYVPIEKGFLALATKVASHLQPFVRIIKSYKSYQNI